MFGWYHGALRKIVNEETNHVRIEQDKDCLGGHNVKVLDHKLVVEN